MQSHEIDYKIIGNDVQLVEVELVTGEVIFTFGAESQLSKVIFPIINGE